MADTPSALSKLLAKGRVTRDDRTALLGHRGFVVWLTGLSGSGKSTLALGLERALHAGGHATFVLDGDGLRRGLCHDLGFSPEDRAENIRRVGHLAALFADAGIATIVAFISPYAADRASARDTVGEDRFLEVFLNAPLSVCEARDPKGLYRRARAGEIAQFTGVSAPYEEPVQPDLTLATGVDSVVACIAALLEALRARELVRREDPV